MDKIILSDKTDAAVYIDGEVIGGLTGVEVTESKKSKALYEMLSEKPWYTSVSGCAYEVELKLYGNSFNYEDGFSMVIIYDMSRYEFDSCYIKSKRCCVNPDGKPLVNVKIICAQGS